MYLPLHKVEISLKFVCMLVFSITQKYKDLVEFGPGKIVVFGTDGHIYKPSKKTVHYNLIPKF